MSEAGQPKQVSLFSPRAVGLISIVGGFPVGFTLSLVNLKRLGDERGFRGMIWAWVLATLGLVAAGLFVPIADLFLLAVNAVSAAIFYFLGTRTIGRVRSSGQAYIPDDAMAGIGIGLVAWIIWFIIFSGLLNLTLYVLGLYGIKFSTV